MTYALPFSKSSFVATMLVAVFVFSLVQTSFYADHDAPWTMTAILAMAVVLIPGIFGLAFGIGFAHIVITEVIPKHVKFKEDY